MNTLLPDLLLIIFDFVPKLTDKIVLTIINTAHLAILRPRLNVYARSFCYPKNFSYVEKIIYRCCYDQYAHLIRTNWLVDSESTEQICDIFIEYGCINLLQISYRQGCWLDKCAICVNSAKNGHLEVLKWARENGCDWNSLTCAYAAENGHLEVLKWARENGCDWDSSTCAYAAENGHLEVLKWARENGCDWDYWTCAYAAENGHLEVLKWARENGCDWDSWTCTYAAENGHLEVLKWARENGCDWDSSTCAYAAENGHLEVLKWARENGCPSSIKTLF